MVEEEKNRIEDNDRRRSDEEPEEEGKPLSTKQKPKLVLIVAATVVVAILGAVGYLVLVPSSQASQGEQVAASQGDEGDTQADTSRDTTSRRSRRGDEEKVPGTDIYFTELPASVVNLGPSEKFDYVYLKYSINLELDTENLRAELLKKMPKITSAIDALITGKVWDQIGTQRGRRSLEQEIVDTVNSDLTTGKVINCYFVTFVAQ